MIWYANRLKESIFENYVEEIRFYDLSKDYTYDHKVKKSCRNLCGFDQCELHR